MKILFLFLLLSVCMHSRAQYKLKDFKGLYRLTSTWEIKTKKGTLVEQWHRVNDTLLQSRSYRVQGKDTIPEETVELKLEGGRITFTPTVPNENEGKPVTFVLSSIDGSIFTFENKYHDFPQRIVYQIGTKTLNVTISGVTKDGYREIPFDFILK